MSQYTESLRQYLKKNAISNREFSRMVGIHETHFSKLIHDKARITPTVGHLIEHLTKGEIKWNSSMDS